MKYFSFFFALLFLISCGSSSTEESNKNTQTSNTTEVSEVAKNVSNTTSSIDNTIDNSEEVLKNVEEKISNNSPTENSTTVKEVKNKIEEKKSEVLNKESSATIGTNFGKKTTEKKESIETKPSTETVANNPVPTPSKPVATTKITEPKIEAPQEVPATKTSEPAPKPEPVKEAFNHNIFDGLLRNYVSSNGKVNYKGFKKDEDKLNQYLSLLENNSVDNEKGRSAKMAYWINAYNAYTIKLILKNYPISSITKLDGGKPWDVKWIKLNGKTLSLNNIENDILRPTYKDARIHFAVNCAAKSCPPLLNRAWTGNNLESNFEKQTKKFVLNTKFNNISTKNVEISQIFEWYAADFGNLVNFLNKYSSTEIKSNAKVSYMAYNWDLNE